jgi:hypothetical protein
MLRGYKLLNRVTVLLKHRHYIRELINVQYTYSSLDRTLRVLTLLPIPDPFNYITDFSP